MGGTTVRKLNAAPPTPAIPHKGEGSKKGTSTHPHKGGGSVNDHTLETIV